MKLRTLIITPTYNERMNLPKLISEVNRTVPQATLLIVDDNSPDGTGVLADQYAKDHSSIFVLHRQQKQGLGKAYIEAFRWGIDHQYDLLIQIDADLSHPIDQLPSLIMNAQHADLVVGSRWIKQGAIVGWPLWRTFLSKGGTSYAQHILGLQVKDLTSGFKCFHRHVLETILDDDVSSTGYCFQIELTWRAIRAGFRVLEVPITFTERTDGESKISLNIILEAIWKVWLIRWKKWTPSMQSAQK